MKSLALLCVVCCVATMRGAVEAQGDGEFAVFAGLSAVVVALLLERAFAAVDGWLDARFGDVDGRLPEPGRPEGGGAP